MIDANNYSFIQAVSLEDVVQGEHTISVIARDNAGTRQVLSTAGKPIFQPVKTNLLQLHLPSHHLNAPLSPSLDRD